MVVIRTVGLLASYRRWPGQCIDRKAASRIDELSQSRRTSISWIIFMFIYWTDSDTYVTPSSFVITQQQHFSPIRKSNQQFQNFFLFFKIQNSAMWQTSKHISHQSPVICFAIAIRKIVIHFLIYLYFSINTVYKSIFIVRSAGNGAILISLACSGSVFRPYLRQKWTDPNQTWQKETTSEREPTRNLGADRVRDATMQRNRSFFCLHVICRQPVWASSERERSLISPLNDVIQPLIYDRRQTFREKSGICENNFSDVHEELYRLPLSLAKHFTFFLEQLFQRLYSVEAPDEEGVEKVGFSAFVSRLLTTYM